MAFTTTFKKLQSYKNKNEIKINPLYENFWIENSDNFGYEIGINYFNGNTSFDLHHIDFSNDSLRLYVADKFIKLGYNISEGNYTDGVVRHYYHYIRFNF